MMMQTFFKQKPNLDTPYRQLALDTDDKGGWRVWRVAGEKVGPQHVKVLETVTVKTFDEGLAKYDEMFRRVEAEGWKPYSPRVT